MALSKDALLLLTALQKQDDALDKIKSGMDKIPPMIKNLKDAMEAEKAKGADLKNLVLTLEKKKKEKELEMAKHEEDAKKFAGQLNTAKTNEAFKALQTEIGFAKQHASDVETEILQIMDQLEAAKKDDKAKQAELGVEVKKFEAEIAGHEKRLAEQKAAYDAAKALRDEAAAPIPKDMMRVYEHIRSRGKLDAIVPVENSICTACQISLAPTMIVELTKMKSLLTCESCQRILFLPALLAPAKTA
jgi:uncharacterized protein